MPITDPAEVLLQAVGGFAARSRPGSQLERQLCDLVIPYLSDIDLQSVRRICVALCQHQYAPRELLFALCKFPARICSVILSYSPALTDDDLRDLIAQDPTGDFALAIARRGDLSGEMIADLRFMGDDRIDRALDLRQKPAAAQGSTTLNKPITEDPVVRVDANELIMLAADPEVGVFATAISDKLMLTLESAVALVSNPTSRNLVIALRYLGLDATQAFAVLSALAPELAARHGVEERFRHQFGEITSGEAARQVQDWQIDDLVAILRQQNAANTDIGIDIRKTA